MILPFMHIPCHLCMFHATVIAKEVQTSSDLLLTYYDCWKIKLNATKTKIQNFKNNFHDAKIFQFVKIYAYNESVKYLGVHFDSKLTYKTHINQTIKKANTIKNKIYLLIAKDSKLSIRNKMLLDKMMRQILIYAASVYCSRHFKI